VTKQKGWLVKLEIVAGLGVLAVWALVRYFG
jgi:hypothetical protein